MRIDRGNAGFVRSYIWDPSELAAVRILSMTRREANGMQEKEHLYCVHETMKNVTSLFGEAYMVAVFCTNTSRMAVSDHVGRQYGGRKRVPLLERIHGWRTGAGLSQFSSVSIRLISLERPHSCWKPANGDWKEIGFMQSEFCKFC